MLRVCKNVNFPTHTIWFKNDVCNGKRWFVSCRLCYTVGNSECDSARLCKRLLDVYMWVSSLLSCYIFISLWWLQFQRQRSAARFASHTSTILSSAQLSWPQIIRMPIVLIEDSPKTTLLDAFCLFSYTLLGHTFYVIVLCSW